MRMNDLFIFLKNTAKRPNLFEFYKAEMLWDDEYISRQLLGLHLDSSIEMVSRSESFMDRSAAWFKSRFNIGKETLIADIACGPGLYAIRFARQGAQVTGIDLSRRSIAYARKIALEQNLSIELVRQDYFKYRTNKKFDLIVMIFCEFCSLSPAQRQRILKNFHAFLAEDGVVVLDVFSINQFNRREECSFYEYITKEGFWAPGEYFGFLNTFKYVDERVILDKYTLVEKDRIRTFYNWLQYFNRESLIRVFEENGFEIESFYGDVAGKSYADDTLEIAVVARKKRRRK